MGSDEFEFQRVHDDFRPRILRYLTRLVGEYEAEDLTQEVFTKINRVLHTFKGEAQLSTWVYRIATNAAIDRMRSPGFQRAVQKELPEDSIEQDEEIVEDRNAWTGESKPSVEQQIVRQEMNECIRGLIEGLSENYRLVLVLGDLEGFRNGEIADILGITLGTVKIRLHRARQALKKELETHCDVYWIEGNQFLPDLKDALDKYRKADQT